jgi:hypothetical protein
MRQSVHHTDLSMDSAVWVPAFAGTTTERLFDISNTKSGMRTMRPLAQRRSETLGARKFLEGCTDPVDHHARGGVALQMVLHE